MKIVRGTQPEPKRDHLDHATVIQLAGAETSQNNLWKDLVRDLTTSHKKSKWFTKVKEALTERSIVDKVFYEWCECRIEQAGGRSAFCSILFPQTFEQIYEHQR